MNAEGEDEEFVGLGLAGHTKQNNDPPPEWGEWHEWNDCSATCDGLRRRSRHVALQGSGHGKFCTGVADEVQNCGSSSACEGEGRSIASGASGTHGLYAA